jgi:hypothetical protein
MMGSSVTTYMLVFITVTMLLAGQQIRIEGRDLKNVTDNLNWDSEKYERAIANITVSYNSTIINGARVKGIVAKTVDWLGYTTFEWGKISLEWGYNHPEYDYRFVWNLLRYLIYLWIFVIVFPILIPLLALLYLMVKGLINLTKRASETIKQNYH